MEATICSESHKLFRNCLRIFKSTIFCLYEVLPFYLMDEIETNHDYVTDKLESWLELRLMRANANEDEVLHYSGSSNGPSSLSEGPWLRLNKFFMVHSSHNQNLSPKCLLCRWKINIISSYIMSHSNLHKYVQVCYFKL